MSEVTLGVDTATFLIVFSSAIIGFYFWNRRRIENKEYEKLMDNPLEFHFFIPNMKLKIPLKYYKQDDEDHTPDELVMPPNFEDDLMILIRPKLSLLINEWYCGFGPPNGKLPELSYSDVYVKQSINRNTPRYIDSYGCVHFEVKQRYFLDDSYIGSMKIKTNEKGNFPLEIVFHVISSEYKEIKREISRKITRHLMVKVE